MTQPDLDDVTVISRMEPRQAAAALRAVGEIDVALALEQAPARPGGRPSSYGIFDMFSTSPKPWMHSGHTFGFLPQKASASQEHEIVAAGEIDADESLRNSRVKISLNRLHVASYPGGRTHHILFDFHARNQLRRGGEDVHFNASFRVTEGSEAAVVGYPIFVGLGVGAEGVSFKCVTVNVKNEEDERFLAVLESSVFRQGLRLAATAQPALAPLSALATGLTKAIATRHRNVPVQSFQLGLDFQGSRMGARLAQGDYVAVQLPPELRRVWRWDDWAFDPGSGSIVSADDRSALPYNYIVFGVTAYAGEER
jgi:hypothetical protein